MLPLVTEQNWKVLYFQPSVQLELVFTEMLALSNRRNYSTFSYGADSVSLRLMFEAGSALWVDVESRKQRPFFA